MKKVLKLYMYNDQYSLETVKKRLISTFVKNFLLFCCLKICHRQSTVSKVDKSMNVIKIRVEIN